MSIIDEVKTSSPERRFKSYPAYKNSGVEWQETIPSSWTVWKMTHAFHVVGSGTTPKSDDSEYYEGDIPWVTTSELRESIITDTVKKITRKALQDVASLRVYPTGTLLFAMYGATIGRMGILAIDATVNQACCAFAKPKTIDTRFAYYWLWMRRPILLKLSAGGGQPNLSQEDLKNIRIPAPALEEQRNIAVFLDRKTERVDELIAKKERQVELLQEKRMGLISHAVTKGLNPKAKMKDSGIEWLGEVPVHWEVSRIAMIADKITNGFVGPTRDILVDEGTKYLQSLHIKNNKITFDTEYYVEKEWSQNHAKSILKRGDVLVVQTGDIGQVAVVPAEYERANCHALIIVGSKPNKAVGEYLAWVLNSSYGYDSLKSIQTGALHPHLNCTFVREVNVPVPPIEEQKQIAEYIDVQVKTIERLSQKIRESMDKLQEYRTALISAAVTGKIDVREKVA